MEKSKKLSAHDWQDIAKSTQEWLAKNNTAIIFAKDGDTIEDVAPATLDRDLIEFGY